ncbi:XRE family transcriptional regulator [Ktedonosporobacter rubrisoli]|uniref:XRE family transcriptional regulator n=1 Tax=Ktedonosporobacter rubrisoli TaxID=2509675 RepID=A0A4P6JQ17_KTERU|nr:XRE family transcriptional regulator [Ktedonosporobacter rubrisoli]
MVAQHRKETSLAGQFLKSYREKHGLTQEQLAYDLNLEPRTLRAYENGERPLNNVKELHRIADRLGVEPEQLGVAGALYVPRTPEEIEEALQHAWELVEESRLREARAVIERLAHNLRTQITSENPALLRSLAQTYHAAGYIVSEATKAGESYEAMLYYKEMETIARLIKDDTLLNIALTYQGDMHRRLGNLDKAATLLEAARDTTPNADSAALGNGIQLLARVYLRKGDMKGFDRAMKESEELSYSFDQGASSTRGHYSPGTVYEEYGRSYGDLGITDKALEYLDRAQANLPKTKFWELLIATSRAMALIRGSDMEAGVKIAVEVTQEIKSVGVLRYLDRITLANKYLENLERKIGNVRKPLADALYEDKVTDY